MSDNSLDGIRRYEDQLIEIRQKAEEALSLAIAGGVISEGSVLDIAHGGTGSSTKNFVDLSTNQFNILGSKIFKSSCGFQKESDVVDSGELAGNVRFICCDEQGADIGAQVRFSGRHTDGDLTPFAFGTIAGRKENGVSGDYSGYLQFASTNSGGTIIEALRINSEQNVGIGAIPTIAGGDRLHISGGDVLLDAVGGNRMIKVAVNQALGRIQSLINLEGGGSLYDTEHFILSINSEFASGTCILDSVTEGLGSAAIDLRASDVGATETGGAIGFLVGDVGECPTLRGRFTTDGLDVIGNAYVTQNLIAGGINNIVNGSGNHTASPNGFVTSDNIKFGSGSPEGYVHAPIGAIYGRNSGGGSDDPDENSTLWVKVFDEGEPTGWRALQAGAGDVANVCVQSSCPSFEAASDGTEVPACTTWFDTSRNMWFYWDSTVHRTVNPDRYGAWLSADLFQARVPITGRSHAQQFGRQIDKDYEYITPVRFSRERLNMFLVDLTASLRVSNNGNDRSDNYYTFDIMTLERRQGDPGANRATRQEWPGDREPYESKKDNIRGAGHTYHTNLRDDLVALSSLTPSGPPIDGSGGVTALGSTRRVLIDNTKTWTDGQWKEDNTSNHGYVIMMTSGLLSGVERFIKNNTTDTITLRRPWPNIGGVDRPQVGDQYQILDSQHRKIIARVSTQGGLYNDGAHVDPTGDRSADPPPIIAGYTTDDSGAALTRSQVVVNGQYKTRDVQDFVTSVDNGLSAKSAGGSQESADQYIRLDHYIDVFGEEEGTEVEPTDAVCLVGLWDKVRNPGKIAGVISITYRLALSPAICESGSV